MLFFFQLIKPPQNITSANTIAPVIIPAFALVERGVKGAIKGIS